MLLGCADKFIVNRGCRDDMVLAQASDSAKANELKARALRAVQQLSLGSGKTMLGQYFARQMHPLKPNMSVLVQHLPKSVPRAGGVDLTMQCTSSSGLASTGMVPVNLGYLLPAEEPADSCLCSCALKRLPCAVCSVIFCRASGMISAVAWLDLTWPGCAGRVFLMLSRRPQHLCQKPGHLPSVEIFSCGCSRHSAAHMKTV